jgi:hypothetical protein
LIGMESNHGHDKGRYTKEHENSIEEEGDSNRNIYASMYLYVQTKSGSVSREIQNPKTSGDSLDATHRISFLAIAISHASLTYRSIPFFA